MDSPLILCIVAMSASLRTSSCAASISSRYFWNATEKGVNGAVSFPKPVSQGIKVKEVNIPMIDGSKYPLAFTENTRTVE